MTVEILQAIFPITGLARDDAEKTDTIRLFSTDLDGTILADPAATARFRRAWAALPRATRPLLVYNTARLTADVRALIANGTLTAPDYLIAALGTEISAAPHWTPFAGYTARLHTAWNADAARTLLAAEPGIEPQPAEFQTPAKLSYYAASEPPRLAARLRAIGIEARVIHSAGRFLDVLPARAGKGEALAWLCTRLGIPGGQTLVAGDSGNDAEMFRLPGVRGIIIGESGELDEFATRPAHHHATQPGPDGVIEGLAHFLQR